MKSILFDVLHNVTLLMAGFYLLGKLSPLPITRESPRLTRVLYGLALSMISLLLMQMTIEAAPGVMIDLRHVPVIVAAYFGGVIPTTIVTVAIIVYRFSMGTNLAAFTAFGFIIAVALGTSLIVREMPPYAKRTFTLVTLYATALHALVLWIVLPKQILLLEVMSVVIPASFVSSWLALLIIRDIRLTKQSLRVLRQKAQLDFLTGLNNSRAFNEYFTDLKQRLILNKQSIVLLTIDIDHFKQINDTYGHEAGDEVLRQFASRLRDGVAESGYLSRNGGEEFSVLFEGVPLAEVIPLAEQLRERIACSPFRLATTDLPLTASFGLAAYDETTSQIDHLLPDADAALYQAKQQGRNQVVLFSPNAESAVSFQE